MLQVYILILTLKIKQQGRILWVNIINITSPVDFWFVDVCCIYVKKKKKDIYIYLNNVN